MLIAALSGRAWSIQELRNRSWKDLHSLWWVCVKERNRIATSNLERQRLNAGYGEWESQEREKVVSVSARRLMGQSNVHSLPADQYHPEGYQACSTRAVVCLGGCYNNV